MFDAIPRFLMPLIFFAAGAGLTVAFQQGDSSLPTDAPYLYQPSAKLLSKPLRNSAPGLLPVVLIDKKRSCQIDTAVHLVTTPQWRLLSASDPFPKLTHKNHGVIPYEQATSRKLSHCHRTSTIHYGSRASH